MNIDNGGPAFPAPDLGEQDFGQRGIYSGMTLRDYAAIKAMAGMLSGHFSHYGHKNYWRSDDIATAAYEMADAMLRARAAKAADGGE